jgi:hypothetical protein
VIHVYAPRKPKEASGVAENWNSGKTKSVEALYPYDCSVTAAAEKTTT